MKTSCISDHCLVCGSKDNLTIDHIVPRAVGGLSIRLNYMILCWHCNQGKKSRDPMEWLSSLGNKASDELKEVVTFAVTLRSMMLNGAVKARTNYAGKLVGYVTDHLTCNRCGVVPNYMSTRQDYCRQCVHMHNQQERMSA